MFTLTAFAATAAGAPAAANPLVQLIPFVFIFVAFWFLLIRPQQQARKKHQEMVMSVRRGDKVVTAGGLVGKVVKVPENSEEIVVEIADGVQVNVMKSTLSDVPSKTEPADKNAGKDKEKK